MNVGRSAPRYQIMALLYPQSKTLQSHLSEYFIIVVRLCYKLLKFTKKSTFQQVITTLSNLDIKTFQSELDYWANSIKEEISLLTAKKVKEEAQENSRFRALSSKLSKLVSHQQRLAINLRVLDFCSKYDYETTWKQTRKVGNATLFSQAAEYQEWKGRANSCTLIYTGNLGSGKSVLLANIVDDLHIHVQSRNTIVAYFFCRHDIPESLEARTVIGSLARQLLRTISDLAIVAELCEETLALDFGKILSLLRRALPPDHKAYFVLDGLDECDHFERNILAQQLQQLQETFVLLLCISFRVEPNNTLELSSKQFTAARITSMPDNNPDIETFIKAELESCLECRKLVIGEPTLILEIQDALLKGSQGMFLWVALQIQSLCAMKTDQAIQDALADLPKDLSETFSRILRRSEGSKTSYQRPILQLVTVACCPLRTDELREALSVVPGDADWTPSRLLNDVYSALACCGCLLIVDEEESTIRFIHHSVKQFLLGGFKDSSNIAFTIDRAQGTMTDTVITYLNYGVFETELSTTRVPQMVIGSVPSRIIRSTADSSNSAQNLALKLLKSKKRLDLDISKTLAEARKHSRSRSIDEFCFYSYAKLYWIQHALCVSEKTPVINDLLPKLLKKSAKNMNATDEDGRKLLLWASRNGHEAVVKVLFDANRVDADSKDSNGWTPLCWASRNGHEGVVKVLLNSGKVDADSKDSNGWTPLWWAAGNGHDGVAKVLLNSGQVDADSKDINGRTPLWWAVQNEHEAIVKVLLDSGQVVTDLTYRDGRTTPLLLAAKNGHEAIVKVMLNSDKVDANIVDINGRTPLWWAVKNGHEAVVKVLLDSGKVDATLKNRHGRTPCRVSY